MIRAPFIANLLSEYEALKGRGRTAPEDVLKRIRDMAIVTDIDGVDDPTLLKYYAWTPKGAEAYASTRQRLYTLFGGAKGGSKTVTGCRIIAKDVAEYRGGLYVVMRKTYTSLHITTKLSFERFFPPELIVQKKTNVWRLVNDNEILWWAADRSRDPDYERTRGLEATGIFPDESSEFDDDFYQLLPSLLRRDAYHIETGETHPGWIYLTSNPVPGTNYLKRRFVDPKTRVEDGQHIFIPSLPDDNPLLPKKYKERAFSTMDGSLLRMLRFGDWDVAISEFVIVPMEHWALIQTPHVEDRDPIAAGIDVGLGRPDETVVYCCNRAGQFWVEDAFCEYDTTRQVERVEPTVARVKANGGKVACDEGSVGVGLVHPLRRKYGSLTVLGYQFGASAEEERQLSGQMERVHDLVRDQLYWWFREDAQVSAEQILLGEQPKIMVQECEKTTQEFENTFFLPTEKWIKIEKKDEIKKRIGRSTDYADGLVLCNAARRKSATTIRLPGGRSSSSRRGRRTMTQGY